ncbi:MAG TPA: HEAT repeat domain-containing protein [Chthonomonadaceae bacterium]|nr:HEAT repeat domain-containing protein [Chthonomonadaceae bacterium]
MRRSLVDARQSRSVRRCAERLTARRRADRMEAVTILDALQDTTAVPALMRVLELYPDDVPFLLAVVGTLERLGDPRALPALRPLTFNHHYTLMQAAHKAIAAIEPRSVLLRPGTAPVPAADTLLRPAAAHVPAEAPHTLLRASQQAEGRDSHEPNFR